MSFNFLQLSVKLSLACNRSRHRTIDNILTTFSCVQGQFALFIISFIFRKYIYEHFKCFLIKVGVFTLINYLAENMGMAELLQSLIADCKKIKLILIGKYGLHPSK